MGSLTRIATVAATLLCLGCSGPVVDTGEKPPATSTSTTPAPPPPQPSLVHLVNNFDYAAAQADGTTAYYFTSPSGRWQCAIVPRVTAGCQTASQSTLGITGAPSTVPGADGESTAPNVIEVPKEGEPRFSAVTGPAFARPDGTPVVLPFNRVLSVAGFRCNVQEESGVACMSDETTRGFTFSPEAFEWDYVDVPADAP